MIHGLSTFYMLPMPMMDGVVGFVVGWYILTSGTLEVTDRVHRVTNAGKRNVWFLNVHWPKLQSCKSCLTGLLILIS